jgi:hypothetical protein
MTQAPNRPPTWFTPSRLLLGGLLLIALLVRGGVLWAMRGNLAQDPDAYREIAENLLRHGEFALGKGGPEGGRQPFHPTAYRPPLYPVLLSNLPTADGQQVSLAKVAVLHLALGVASVWLTWLTARRVGQASLACTGPPSQTGTIGGPAFATANLSHPTIAGLIVALDPILLNQQTLVMTETLAAFLAILSLYCLARFDAERSWFNAGLAGGAIGLAVLCRPTFLPWLGLVGLTMLVVRGGPNFRFQISDFRFSKQGGAKTRRWFSGFGWRLANLAALGIVASGVMSPWAIRNYRVFGKPIITTTHGGYTLYLANNKAFYSYVLFDSHDIPYRAEFTPMAPMEFWRPGAARIIGPSSTLAANAPGKVPADEVALDQTLSAAGWSAIVNMPQAFGMVAAYRQIQLWSPLPHSLTLDESNGRRLLRYATCFWYCCVYVLAAIGIWRLRWRLLQPPWIWGVLLCLAFTAVHTFYWTNLRMRAPLMPFVAMVAGAAVVGKSKVDEARSG